jgi:hypothetical protein
MTDQGSSSERDEELAQRVIQAGRNLMDAYNRSHQLEDWLTMGHLIDNDRGYAFLMPVAGKYFTVEIHQAQPQSRQNPDKSVS